MPRRLRAFSSAAGAPVQKAVTSQRSLKIRSARLCNDSRRKTSPLQQDETSYFATAVIEKNSNGFKVATVSWPKEPFETWLAQAESQVPAAMRVPQASYALPKTFGGAACNENTWMATAAPGGPDSHTAVWTGSEMIIWGGGG